MFLTDLIHKYLMEINRVNWLNPQILIEINREPIIIQGNKKWG